jgi:hypothetical protein
VRYGLNEYQGRTTLEPASADTVELASSLLKILEDANWKPTPVLLRDAMQGNGIAIEVNPDASPSTVRAAEALVKAIGNVPLMVSAPLKFPVITERRMDDLRVWIKGKETSLPPLDENTIILVVLKHPA